MSKKVAFYTLGCKLNFSETSAIGRQFNEAGFETVSFTDKADVYLINTCSVTDHADKKCRKVVKEALKHSPNAYIAIVGCYAQLKPKEISEIPGVDVVLGAAEKFMITEYITDLTKKEKTQIFNQDISKAKSFISSYSFGERTRTFLKVQDGCDYTCSFCTIPLARGSSRSDTISHVIEQANEIAQSGVKEIVLTGVNLGDFGIRDGVREDKFFDLIQALDQVQGIDRIRISSIEPNLLSNEIIEFVSQSTELNSLLQAYTGTPGPDIPSIIVGIKQIAADIGSTGFITKRSQILCQSSAVNSYPRRTRRSMNFFFIKQKCKSLKPA
jgi:threonylcarbamoyladenosine tRNA methylthiotransferase MtaB